MPAPESAGAGFAASGEPQAPTPATNTAAASTPTSRLLRKRDKDLCVIVVNPLSGAEGGVFRAAGERVKAGAVVARTIRFVLSSR